MNGIAVGTRGPEFYSDMTPEDLAAHQARDNGALSAGMSTFDEQIQLIEKMSTADKALVSTMKWEAIRNG